MPNFLIEQFETGIGEAARKGKSRSCVRKARFFWPARRALRSP